jgi:Tol biopolymer transport system component
MRMHTTAIRQTAFRKTTFRKTTLSLLLALSTCCFTAGSAVLAQTSDNPEVLKAQLSADAQSVFQKAELLFPDIFATASEFRTTQGFIYKAYAKQGTYIGIKDGMVYVLGGPFGGSPQNKGSLAAVLSFLASVTPPTMAPETPTPSPGYPPKIIFSPEFSSTTSTLKSAFTNAVFSADGRYILASTDTSVAGNQLNLFLYDLQNTKIERIGVFSSTTGGNTPFAKSFDISGDGRYLTFESNALGLANDADPSPRADIFVFDRLAGTTTLISTGADGTHGPGEAKLPSISKDGRYIAFESSMRNLVANDTNNAQDIFVYDQQTATTERVSLTSSGQEFPSGYATTPVISADGRYVVFNSNARMVPSDVNSIDDVFVYDRQTKATEKVSVSSSGLTGDQGSGDAGANGKVYRATISADGGYVAFASSATNLVAGDTNGIDDIFVRDRQASTTQRVSLDKESNQTSKVGSFVQYYRSLQLSEDGRFLSFASFMPNLVAADTFQTHDFFIRDLKTGITTKVVEYNVNTDVNGGIESRVVVSRDARYVAYTNLDIVPPGIRTTNLYFTDRGSY